MNKQNIYVNKYLMHIDNQYNLDFVEQYNSPYLIPTKIFDYGDQYMFEFNLDGFELLSYYRIYDKADRFRLLLNLSKLYTITNEIVFHLHPDNIAIDDTLSPKILVRDININNDIDFIAEFKIMIAYILADNVTYDEVYNVGVLGLVKYGNIKKYIDLNNIDDIVAQLQVDYQEYVEQQHTKMKTISKNKYRNLRWFFYVSLVGLIILIGTTLYLYNQNHIYQVRNELRTNYINDNLTKVIDNSTKLSMKQLSAEDKYIISSAFIKSSTLDEQQKTNALKEIKIDGNEKVLNYWTYLARNDYAKAYEEGTLIGNYSYRGYVLLLYLDYLEHGENVTPEQIKEKDAVKKELEKLAKEDQKE